MPANQVRPCMWCQTPLRHMEDCPECDKVVPERVVPAGVVLRDEITEADIRRILRLGSLMNRGDDKIHDEAYKDLMELWDEFTDSAQSRINELVRERSRSDRFKIQALKERADTMHIPDFPNRMKCDRYGNLLAFDINRKQWAIVSFHHYTAYRVCYSQWAYLPAEPA